MKTVIKKGLEITEHKDGTKTYKPYALLSDNKRYYVSSLHASIGNIYSLSLEYTLGRKSEKEAIEILNIAVTRFEQSELEQYNKQVVNKYDKEIK